MSALKLAPGAFGEAQTVRVADTLTAIGQELEHARTLGLRVEQTICAIAVRSSIDSALIAELQQLDAVLQRIAALRDFSEQLALQCDDSFQVDVSAALTRVTLADVRSRLAGEHLVESEEGWEIL